jgi:hypothetical protein
MNGWELELAIPTISTALNAVLNLKLNHSNNPRVPERVIRADLHSVLEFKELPIIRVIL